MAYVRTTQCVFAFCAGEQPCNSATLHGVSAGTPNANRMIPSAFAGTVGNTAAFSGMVPQKEFALSLPFPCAYA